MEGLIDNAKKFMASEEGQKMQATFEQQGGADIDSFLGKGDASKTQVREQDNDYSGYGGEDSTAEGGWGANKGGDSFSRQNQLGAESNDSGDASVGRTGNNDTNYDGGRAFDASGTSTPAYRQEDDELEGGDNGSSGKTQGGGSYGLNPYGDNSTKMDNPLHEQHQ